MAKFYKILLILITITISSSSHSKDSYAEQILSGNFESELATKLGYECLKSIIMTYRDKKDFNIPELQDHTIELKNYYKSQHALSIQNAFEYEGLKDNIFYHYFFWKDKKNNISKRAEIVNKYSFSFFLYSSIKANKLLSDLLSTLRSNLSFESVSTANKNNELRSVLYIAGSPYSSSQYGDTLLSFTFDPKSLILPLYTKAQYNKYNEFISLRLKEKNNEVFNKCNIESEGVSKLMALIIFDSKIDLVHYYGNNDWFQIVRSENVKESSLIKMKSPPLGYNFSIPKLRIRSINKFLKKKDRDNEILSFDNARTRKKVKEENYLQFTEY
jgi:hypothetical protein